MRIRDLALELEEAERRFWFIQQITELEQTDDALRARLEIRSGLFVQVFLSETTGRFSLALIQQGQRLYGRDREHGEWHCHPYEAPSQHEPMPEGVSPRPLLQFLAEVERILLVHELL